MGDCAGAAGGDILRTSQQDGGAMHTPQLSITPYSDPNEPEAAISYRNLRRAIGLLALALPVVLLLGWWILDSVAQPDSISAYYYTHERDYFVGTMWAIGVFLVFYRYAPRDNVFSTVLGVLAVAISLFPTDQHGASSTEKTIGVIHACCASVFLLGLALFSFFVFTRTADDPPALFIVRHPSVRGKKAVRNQVYRGCGVAIAVFLAIAVVGGLQGGDHGTLLFWMESLSVWAFAVSWLVKGDWLWLADTPGAPQSSIDTVPYPHEEIAETEVSVEQEGDD
jgi:hypothetical protein